MKEYKGSRYNHFVRLQGGIFDYIAGNAYSGNIMLADNELIDLLQNCDQKGLKYVRKYNRDLFAYLIENGYLVDAAINELDLVRIKFGASKYSKNNMHLTIVPTDKCNLGCIYCYENKSVGSRMSKNTIERIKRFVKDGINDLSSFEVTWYGGEPLLEIEAIEEMSKYFIDLANTNNVTYSANMITNGTLLSEELVNILLRLKINYLQITVDGIKDIHDSRRFYGLNNEGSFCDIINALKICLGKIKVGIRVNVDKTNITRYHELMDYFYQEKIIGPNCENVVSLGLVKDWTGSVMMNKDNMFSFDEFRFWSSDLKKILSRNNMAQHNCAEFNPKSPCGAVSVSNYLITPRGDLKKCWIHVTGKDGIVGNLNKGVDLGRLDAVKWLSYDPTSDEKCSECSLLPICAGGCPYDMMTKPDRKEEYCKYIAKYYEGVLADAVLLDNK
ncbi:radical SAM/SPASM domain-containing protein [Chlorobium ferrooxidans]|uniref:Radical SAM n=1 Tax=Chlorobium ferrooxidans DSM 13031 TaxID=377431 RepID=Q0YSC7_9CHLB|nr:radical SAM protein [Chlorobium ferrooxidans]EAT59291.1 Radical SAM [Chlorobium ferrooxidans DSM 13031]